MISRGGGCGFLIDLEGVRIGYLMIPGGGFET